MPINEMSVKFQSEPPSDLDIAVLDDEMPLFEGWWKTRSPNANLFTSPDSFLDWLDQRGQNRPACVIDLHLNHAASGIDVIRTISPATNLYLATSDHLNAEALEVAALYGVAILPKALLFS